MRPLTPAQSRLLTRLDVAAMGALPAMTEAEWEAIVAERVAEATPMLPPDAAGDTLPPPRPRWPAGVPHDFTPGTF